MTATAIAAVAGPDDGSLQLQAALWLALLSGSMMLLMGALRLGFVAHFLSHPVISGFVSASGLLIAASQFKHLVGISAHGDTLVGLLPQLFKQLPSMHGPSLAMGLAALTLLVLARRNAKPWLLRGGLSAFWADLVAKAVPVMVLLLSTGLSAALALSEQGVKVVGPVPVGLPSWTWPAWDASTAHLLQQLWVPALLISLVGFVESVSVGQSLAAKRRERIDPDAELRALGLSNLGAGLTGGFPVTGGFSRSVVNFDAGARYFYRCRLGPCRLVFNTCFVPLATGHLGGHHRGGGVDLGGLAGL
jgi:sulfate permease, SulP family